MTTIKVPTPHIGAQLGDIAETVLLPGDPLRAKYIAETFLTDAVQFNSVRNIFGYTGYYNDKRVSVMATGMGCPSMGIYSYELIHGYGCKNLIRIGTCGAMQEHVKIRDVVMAMGVSTNSNYMDCFKLPGQFACTCSFDLLRKAVDAADAMGMRYHVGNILCSDNFYHPETPATGVSWADMGILACEMESTALYSNAAYAGVNAFSMFTVSDSLVTGEVTTAEERQTSFTDMMKIALELA